MLLLNFIFVFIISGTICSLIDRVLWGGSLDYILIKGLFIFDIKDTFITTFELLMVFLIIKHFKLLSTMNSKALIMELKAFIISRFKKEIITND